MAVILPTTSDLIIRNIALFEAKLNQTVPDTEKAFIKILSVVLAVIETEHDKKIIDEKKTNACPDSCE